MSTSTAAHKWQEDNQRYLSLAISILRQTLAQHSDTKDEQEASPSQSSTPAMTPDELHAIVATMPTPPALETLCVLFDLSSFERDILLLCAGIELDASLASLCATMQNEPTYRYPTFSLALATLPASHWSALTPNAPLRRWRLIELGSAHLLTASPLRIDERILHFLTGIQYMDERLLGILEPLHEEEGLVPSHQALVERMTGTWSEATTSRIPVIQLCGNEPMGKRNIAMQACSRLGLNVHVLHAHALPANAAELEALIRLWEREAALTSSALLLDCDEADASDKGQERAIAHLIDTLHGVLIVTSRERQYAFQRPVVTFDVRKPSASEQKMLWQSALGERAAQMNGKVDLLVSQFSLNTSTISAASQEAFGHISASEALSSTDELLALLWDTCRVQARPRLDDMAQRIEPAAAWDDLVVPELQRHVLRDIAAHVRQRAKVYETWGFAAKSARGLGISALFAGASGTGKTMAAEVLANELRLDLYRIDLSQIVSKYIGETEKNLRRVFNAAEEGGAILLFDEADALFGKRSEVRDSHDRFANIEVSYLLQRMEAYRGLAILTTNMKHALDNAFMRRIRFIVQFPFPDGAQRAEIWRHIFPIDTPTADLDMAKLARLNVTGGNIHNIALNAAFLAADAGEPVQMKHLLRAARSEYGKLEKSLTEAEIGGWV